MASPTTEATAAGNQRLYKDKRALVLFLFGLGLLLFDFRPTPVRSPRHGYALKPGVLDQLVWHDSGDLHPELVPLSVTGVCNPKVAARYALFLYQPLAINRASGGDLELLPGIGPQLAQNILARIARSGPFQTPDDLAEVHGLGPKKIQQLLPLITFTTGK